MPPQLKEAEMTTGHGAADEPVVMLPDDEHNRSLVEAVHPPDWTNPTPDGRYNLVVVGVGLVHPSGRTCATRRRLCSSSGRMRSA